MADVQPVTAPEDPALLTGLIEAMGSARPEEPIAALPAEGGGYRYQNIMTDRSRTTGEGRRPPGTLALGHRHQGGGVTAGVADNYPGLGDPVTVLSTGVSLTYSNGNIGGVIGFNGTQMTLSAAPGLELPSYAAAPAWVRDVFVPWP